MWARMKQFGISYMVCSGIRPPWVYMGAGGDAQVPPKIEPTL